MPHYDYECKKCGHVFEAFQKISDKPLKLCPECKGSLRRLIGAGCGLIFKGSGFYATDYKRKGTSQGKKDASRQDKDKDTKQSSCSSCPKNDSQNCSGKSDKKD